MKNTASLLFAAALLGTAVGLHAGETTPPAPPAKHSLFEPIEDFTRDSILKPVAPFELVPGKDPNGWGFVLEPYVWAMGLDGNVGVKGLPASHVNSSARTVLQHLDWGIFARGEIRKGRWGLLADGYYAALSASATPSNKIYDSANVGLQQSLVSLALAYRIIDDRRGYLDLYAGARYNFIGSQFNSSLNDSRISQISDNLTSALGNRVDSALDSAISAAIAKATSSIDGIVSEISGNVGDRIKESELRRLLLGNEDLREMIRRGVLKGELTSDRVKDAFREYVRASAMAKVSAAKGVVDPVLESAASNAKKKLSKEISNRIKDVTPTYAAGSQWWVDPIIGLRGQINFTRWLFLAAQGDVGGFYAGSQIAWNVQATLGVNITRNVFAELGYRYMYVDYANGGFLYNMNSYGLYSGLGVKF